MSDFTAFESAPQEEDPAAEFLAREQEELAQLEGENFEVVEGSDAQATLEGLTDAALPTADTNDILSEFDTPAAVDDNEPTLGYQPQIQGGDALADYSAFEDEPQTQSNDLLDEFSSDVGSAAPSDAYSAVSQHDKVRQEPEKIRKWREEQKVMLEEKDAQAEKEREEWKAVAKQELADWYKHRDEQLIKNKANNRESEEVFVKERDTIIPGHEWERICKMCDFNPKNSKNQKDVSRMRSIVLHLKQNAPEKTA